MRVLVTGAAGSIGSALCRALDNRGIPVVAFDQAETPLFWLQQQSTVLLKAIVGDVLDYEQLSRAIRGCTHVVHAAAMKHVGMCDTNVSRAYLVNVAGTMNVVDAANGERASLVLVSTDKAVNPTTVMGATKWLAEWYVGTHALDARIVRLVNIWRSAGSLAEILEKLKAADQPLALSHPDASRYFMSIADAVDLLVRVMDRVPEMARVFIPASFTGRRIADIAAEMGVRTVPGQLQPGEKIAEEMLTAQEARARAADVARNNYSVLVQPPAIRLGQLSALQMAVSHHNDEAAYAELFKLVRSHHG